MIKPSLYKSIEFSQEDEALRWFPMWPQKKIILDPQRSFGRPIIVDGSVPTDILAEAVKVEKSIKGVAHWYEVPITAVREAVKFEQKLAA